MSSLDEAGAVTTFWLLYLFLPSKDLGKRGWGKRLVGNSTGATWRRAVGREHV